MSAQNTAIATEAVGPTINQLPPIGAEFAGGFFAGILQIHNLNQKFALIVAGKDGEITDEWGKYGKKIDARSPWNGWENTNAMIEADSPLAKRIRDLRIGGCSDWSVPARDQLEVLYRNLKPTTQENYCWGLDGYNAHNTAQGEAYTSEHPAQTAVENFKADAAHAFAPEWYWSSTQYSADSAFNQDFELGFQGNYAKGSKFRARAVRMIQLSD